MKLEDAYFRPIVALCFLQEEPSIGENQEGPRYHSSVSLRSKAGAARTDSFWRRFVGGYLRRKLFLAMLAVHSIAPLHGQCFAGSLQSFGQLYKSTGNEDLDEILHYHKSKMENLFGVRTQLYIYDDSRAPNAYAVPCGDFSKCKHGTILFGYNMLLSQLWKSNNRTYAVIGVMAHEFAHVLQFLKHNNLPTKLKELHADYLAGYYLGKEDLSRRDMEVFAQSLFEMGDYNFWSPDHHGTPQERVQAMIAGFMAGKHDRSVDEAYREGIEWVVYTHKFSDFVTCSVCRGKGREIYRNRCGFCKGYGAITCDYCRGQGGYWTDGPHGYGYYTCRKCRGHKRLRCSECGGRGFFEGYGATCRVCNGEGRVRRR